MNTAEVFANVASTTVSSGGTDAPVSGTVQTWTVTSSTGFPAASATTVPATQFHVSDPDFPSEQIAVTTVSGTTWTVTRGSEGSTPVQHAAGFTVYAVGTAGALSAFAVPINGGSRFLPSISVPPPSGDTSGATDTAAIAAIENAADSAGGILLFGPGTYYVTGLTKQAYTIWQGSGRLSTTIMLASGSDTDVVRGANFSTLTLSGSNTGGISGWGIRDLTIDGNKASQTGTSYGLRVYGYNFDLSNLSIRNCLTDGLYTEWGNSGAPGPDASMEARAYGVKIHGCGGNGWHNRGPHDSRAYDLTIFANGSGAVSYWTESCTVATTVAAGSNNVNVATFTGSGVLNVASTLGYPSASISPAQGSLTVATSGGSAVITYTGTTATTFTGCTTTSGSGTLSTSGSVAATGGGYSANGCLLFGAHCYGSSAAWQYQLDAATHLNGCIGEVAATGIVLVRGVDCVIEGGWYFVLQGASQTGLGIQLGDTVNVAWQTQIRTFISNLACSGASTAALVIASDAGNNDIDAGIYAASGSVVISGTPSAASRYRVHMVGQGTSGVAAQSLLQDGGQWTWQVAPAANNAWLLTQAGTDILNVNTSGSIIASPNGYSTKWYSDGYSTLKASINGASGAATFTSAAMGGGKITGLGNGSAATDAAAFGQIPLVDSTAAHILTDGAQAAGANGKWADSGHVHPAVTGGMSRLSSVVGWTSPPGYASANLQLPTAGVLFMWALEIPIAATTTNFNMWVNTGGGTLSNVYAALVSTSGSIVVSTGNRGTDSSLVSNANLWSPPWSSPGAISAGEYYASLLIGSFTLAPTFAANAQRNSGFANIGCSAGATNLRAGAYSSGLGSLPSSVTMASVGANGNLFWVALT